MKKIKLILAFIFICKLLNRHHYVHSTDGECRIYCYCTRCSKQIPQTFIDDGVQKIKREHFNG